MFEAWVLVCIAGQLNQCISARDTRGPYETIEQCQDRTVEMSASILNTIPNHIPMDSKCIKLGTQT